MSAAERASPCWDLVRTASRGQVCNSPKPTDRLQADNVTSPEPWHTHPHTLRKDVIGRSGTRRGRPGFAL